MRRDQWLVDVESTRASTTVCKSEITEGLLVPQFVCTVVSVVVAVVAVAADAAGRRRRHESYRF